MERWCLHLMASGIKSCSRPYASLALLQFHAAQLNELQARYDLAERLGNAPGIFGIVYYLAPY